MSSGRLDSTTELRPNSQVTHAGGQLDSGAPPDHPNMTDLWVVDLQTHMK